MPSRRSAASSSLLVALACGVDAFTARRPARRRGSAQERGPQTISPDAIQAAIDSLGNLDFPVRMNASRTLRRAPAEAVAPALIRAVESHKDQFVRFRALVLLTAFNDARTAELVREIVDQSERSAADGGLHVLRASSDAEHDSRAAEGARARGKRVRAACARARARRAGQRSARARDAARRSRTRPGFFQERGHRGARRLPAPRTPSSR